MKKYNPANNLAYYRTISGLSQSELAKAVDISTRTLQDYEQGTKSINGARAITLYKMSHVLGTDMESLLEIEEEV